LFRYRAQRRLSSEAADIRLNADERLRHRQPKAVVLRPNSIR
jgi:hypothetical protein